MKKYCLYGKLDTKSSEPTESQDGRFTVMFYHEGLSAVLEVSTVRWSYCIPFSTQSTWCLKNKIQPKGVVEHLVVCGTFYIDIII